MLHSSAACCLALTVLVTACTAPAPADVSAAKARSPLYDGAPTEDDASDDGAPEERLSELHGFYFVVNHGGPLIVLDDAGALDLAAGAPIPLPFAEDDDVVAALAPVVGGGDAHRQPDDSRRELVLYGADGVVCFGVTGARALLYRDQRDPSDPDAGVHFAERAAESAPGGLLVAPLAVDGGDCTGAVWARESTLTAPRVFVPEGEPTPLDDAEWARPLWRTARALPEYESAQRDFEQHAKESSLEPTTLPWDEQPEAVRTAQRYVDLDSGESLVSVDLSSLGGCGDFNDALWTLAGARETHPRGVSASMRASGGTKTVLDIDDDGVLEVLSGNMLQVTTENGPRFFTLPEAYFVCPC